MVKNEEGGDGVVSEDGVVDEDDGSGRGNGRSTKLGLKWELWHRDGKKGCWMETSHMYTYLRIYIHRQTYVNADTHIPT